MKEMFENLCQSPPIMAVSGLLFLKLEVEQTGLMFHHECKVQNIKIQASNDRGIDNGGLLCEILLYIFFFSLRR